MKKISHDLKRIIDEFSSLSDVTPSMVDNLRKSIETSAALVEQMNKAVEEGHLKAFVLLKDDVFVGASYDSSKKLIQLPLASLTPAEQNQQRVSHDLTFALGHEIQHGFNHAERQRANYDVIREMTSIAKNKDPRNIYDDPAEHWIQASREDEAKAHIAGWNVALTRLRQENPEAGLAEMLDKYPGRAKDFVAFDSVNNSVRPKPGLTFGSDNSLSPTSENVEMMGKYYYDNPNTKVGRARSSYRNYDGAVALGLATDIQRKHAKPYQGQEPQFLVDMQSRGLQEDKLEINGINLGRDGARHPRQPYYDTSRGQMRPGFLDHTAQSHVYVPIAPSAPSSQGDGLSLFSDRSHRDHALYAELKQRLPPETSTDRLAQITLAAKLGGVQAGQVQSIAVKDDAVFVVGKTPGDRAKVDLSTPPPLTEEQTMQRSETFDRQQAQTLEYRAQQAQLNF